MRNVVHCVKLTARLIFIYYLQQMRNIIVMFVISPMLFSHFSKISPMFLSCLNLSNVYTIVFNLSAFFSWSSKLLLVLILKIRDVFLRKIFLFFRSISIHLQVFIGHGVSIACSLLVRGGVFLFGFNGSGATELFNSF